MFRICSKIFCFCEKFGIPFHVNNMAQGDKMVQLNNDHQLVITYNYSEPIELVDFTESLKSLAYEYKKHLKKEGVKYTTDTKLYVKNVQEGSIEIWLAVATAFEMVSNINATVTFFNNLKNGFLWLKGRLDNNPGLDKQDVIAKQNIVAPIITDERGAFKVEVKENNGNIYNGCIFNVGYNDANTISRQAEREIENMEAIEGNRVNNTLLAIHQASKATGGFKGIAHGVNPNPKKVTFDTPELKQQILDAEDNMFRKAYLVDLRVESKGEKIVLYNIMAIRDVLDFDEIENEE